MKINIELFLETLPYMVKGMLGIFMVTLIIMSGITILNMLTSNEK